MATNRIRARMDGDAAAVKAIIAHPMETGRRRDSATGKLIPEHYITEVLCVHNGKTVLTAQWGPAVSRNPYLSFRVRGGKPGDRVELRWTDSRGESGSLSATVD